LALHVGTLELGLSNYAKKNCGQSGVQKIESLSKIDGRTAKVGHRYIIVFSEY